MFNLFKSLTPKTMQKDQITPKEIYDSIRIPDANIPRRKLLINSLSDCVYALQNNTIFYKWDHQSSCNCGIVVQSILDKNKDEVGVLFDDECEQNFKGEENNAHTWKALVQQTCNATGRSVSKIVNILMASGMRPEDIVHLEYLENEAILAKTDIDTGEKNYHAKKENLIAYLKAWIAILHTNKSPYTVEELKKFDKQELEERLLIASSEGEIDRIKELKSFLILN